MLHIEAQKNLRPCRTTASRVNNTVLDQWFDFCIRNFYFGPLKPNAKTGYTKIQGFNKTLPIQHHKIEHYTNTAAALHRGADFLGFAEDILFSA